MKKITFNKIVGKSPFKNKKPDNTGEGLYKTLIENIPQKIFCKDKEGKYLSINSAYAEDLGMKPFECIGKGDFDFFPKELAEKYRADDLRIMAMNKIEDIEEDYMDDGELRTVHTTKVPLRDEKGDVIGIMGIFWDITEQNRAVENLKKQEYNMTIRDRISRIFLYTPDENMFDEILNVIMDVTESKMGIFGYIDEDGSLIVPSMTHEVWWNQYNVADKYIHIPHEKWETSFWADSLINKKPYLTNEASKNLPIGSIQVDRHISMPVIYRGEAIGLIQIANRDYDYNEKDIAILETLISQIAPSLIARLQRDREEKKRKLIENQIKDTVEILTEASGSILAATSQVTSSMIETATSINETSTTVEEVRQSARISSDKAKNVSETAQKTAQVSQSGQKAVEDNSKVMDNIRRQMDSIAQTIIQLSEQSQSIGGIIASVTDIADQSNLLAVNAAIEAARAGDQGKSFAVVAQEIKNLATQSKNATSQVRTILNDIQKTTSVRSVFDINTYITPTETYQYLERTSSHPCTTCLQSFLQRRNDKIHEKYQLQN